MTNEEEIKLRGEDETPADVRELQKEMN